MIKTIADKYFRFVIVLKKLIKIFSIKNSRILAHKYRKQVIRKNKRKVVNQYVKRIIKEYSKHRFGKKTYWPYLALYTEIRGEFIKGWLPYDYFRYILLPRMNPPEFCYISEQKTFDHRLFGDFAIKPLFVFISGMFLDADFKFIDENKVKKCLSDYDNTIVIKEETGTKGKQVTIIHSSEFILDKLNRKINYIIQPYIKQYKVLEDLHPGSLNTFRVTTFLKTEGSVDIKFVVLRFGVDDSKVDNISSGGQYIYFDISGKPTECAYDIKGFKTGNRHKNTGYVFSKINIPMFQEMLEKCKDAHKKYPYVRLVGWDVCITEQGEPKLVEWNADNPGFWFWEVIYGPFWANDDQILEFKYIN